MKAWITALAALAVLCAQAQAQTLRVPQPNSVTDGVELDPMSPLVMGRAMPFLYSRLVRPDLLTGLPEADLAVAWEPSGDAQTWLFNMRTDVTFHDGTPFTAADAAFAINRGRSEALGGENPLLAMVENVTATDPLTLLVELSEPYADFPLLLMDPRLFVVSADACASAADEVCMAPVGTGPFAVGALDPEGFGTLVRFPDYWEGPARLEAVELVQIVDAEARVQAFLADEVDVIEGLDPRSVPLIEERPAVQVDRLPQGPLMGLAMRTDREPFDDARVRRAMRVAVDRPAMLAAVLGENAGTIACDNPVWPNDPYRLQMECPADPPLALALLEEAGYPDGIDVILHASAFDEQLLEIAKNYQEQVAASGIAVTLVEAPAEGYWGTVWMQEDFFATQWLHRPAPVILEQTFASGAAVNETGFANEKFDELMSEAKQEIDLDKRTDLYAQMQRLIFEEGGSFFPFHASEARGYTTRLDPIPPVDHFSVRWNEVGFAGEE